MGDLDRVPPQDTEAEAAVLGAMFLSTDAAFAVLEHLETSDFYEQRHRLIFDVLQDLARDGKATDILLVRERLERQGELDAAGGILYLNELVERVPTAANAEYYARIIKEKAILRNLINVATEVVGEAYESTDQAVDVLDWAERRIFETTQRRVSDGTAQIRDVLHQIMDKIDQRESFNPKGVPSDFVDLDELIQGFNPSELVILAARPSMGKSSLALNFCLNCAIEHQLPVGFFSLEMSQENIIQNMLCCHARVNATNMRKGMLSQDEMGRVSHAAAELYEAPVLVDDTPGLKLMELRGRARRMKAQHDVRMIVVDYLQLLEVGRKSDNRQQEVSLMSRSLKSIARELDIPVIVLSQLNRSAESRESKRPRLSDLRESGAIEQDADKVLLLFRPAYYWPDKEEFKNKATVIVAKNRNGPTGEAELFFRRHMLRFENAARHAIHA